MSKYLFHAPYFTTKRFSCASPFLLSLFLSFVLGESFAYSQCAPLAPAAPSSLTLTAASTTVSTPTSTPTVNSSGLVAYWKFDDGNGTTTCDSSGNGNSGTLINGPLWTTGRVGKALYFDGVDDSVTVADSASLRLSSSFTLSAWVNPASVSSDWKVVLVKNDTYYLFSSVPGSFCGGNASEGPFGGFSSPDINFVCQSLPLPINTWTHLALTYNGSALTLYRNGIEAARTNISETVSPRTQTLQIGGSKYGEYFKGLIDEVRIYNRALTATEIQAIHAQDSNLVAQWKFDEGSGTTAADFSGNNNHGTLVNGPVWTTGRVGKALYFDGVDDSVTVADSASLRLSSSFTLSAWVNPASMSSDWKVVLVKNDTYYLFSSVPGSFCGGNASEGPFGGFSSPDINFVCQSLPLPINTWTHLALTYNGSALTLYRNGIEAARTNISETVSPRTQTLQIGGSKYGEYFKGLIDEVRVYNRAVNSTEIQALYQQDAPATSQTGLAASDSFSFSLANSGDKSLNAGSSVTNTLNASLLSGSSQQISFSVSGLPSGATASFSQGACSPACSSVLNIATTAGTSAGNFPITVTATGGGMIKTTSFALSVFLAATSSITSVSAAAGPASLYVAKHGSDSYSCSQAANPSTPKLSIANALDCISHSPGAGANKTIEVAAGTYTESLIRSNSFPKGSSWSAPFTLRAKAGDAVIIRPTSASFVFQINDEDSGVPFYAIIQGFTFDGANVSSWNVAIFASYVRMVGNELINNESGGLIGGGGRVRFEFINNKIHGGKFVDAVVTGGEYLYPVYWGGDNALFEGNEFYDFPSFGFHLYPNPSNAIIRNNIVRDFGWAATCPGGDPRCAGRGPDDRGVGILTGGTGHQIYNNIVWNGTKGIDLYRGSGKQAYRNTVYNMRLGGILSLTSEGNVVTNNIVYNPKSPRDGDIFSYQSPDTTTYGNNLCARGGTGCSVVADPLFVDAANGNFNLQSVSPAAGVGAALY